VPELPDIALYIEHLERRVRGRPLERVRIASPSLLRTVEPPPAAAEGLRVVELRRLGKRIAIGLEGELHLAFHLMIAGRFRWREREAKLPGRLGLAALDFETGTLLLTEAGTKKRASLHVVQGEEALLRHDPGGIDPLTCSAEEFTARLCRPGQPQRRGAHRIDRAP
jgi:formamidopyrimidine-DNA glycosylase